MEKTGENYSKIEDRIKKIRSVFCDNSNANFAKALARLFVSFCFMFVQKICQHFADMVTLAQSYQACLFLKILTPMATATAASSTQKPPCWVFCHQVSGFFTSTVLVTVTGFST